MNELSVNISGAERQQIERKAIDLFIKTAKARHPDPDFYKHITKRIFEDALDNFTPYLESPLFEQLNFISTYSLSNEIRRLSLPDNMNILTLCNENASYSRMLDINNYLAIVDTDDLIIPSQFIRNRKILFPFRKFGDTNLVLSPEIVSEINEYNGQMTELYESLDKQLHALINVISQCKTTKAFYAKLPNLTSLFPNSLKLKVSRKNNTEEIELTDEQKLMQDATNSIATASLLGD